MGDGNARRGAVCGRNVVVRFLRLKGGFARDRSLADGAVGWEQMSSAFDRVRFRDCVMS